MALFDRYLIVDWSAANTPKRGRDSIWIALYDGGDCTLLSNVSTRSAAIAQIRTILRETLAKGQRLLCGFDFAFGYPKGMSERIAGKGDWQSLWKHWRSVLQDGADNRSNSFEVAARINRDLSASLQETGPYWGHPHQHQGRYAGLLPKRNGGVFQTIPEFRLVEKAAKGAKSVWQLAYNGAVGRQAMLGMAQLQDLRTEPAFAGDLAVWPFETEFARKLEKPIVISEVYPSLFPLRADLHEVKDAAQVLGVATHFAELDEKERLGTLLDAPDCLGEAERKQVETEEGWIVGAGHDLHCATTVRIPETLNYVRDPQAIYRQSFAEIQKLEQVQDLPGDMRDVAVRVIHACGMPDIANDLRFSEDALRAGRKALANGAAILCDAEMVRSGITQRLLPDSARPECAIALPETVQYAGSHGMTRAAAQIDLWGERLNGAILVIGNAPTALFRLLERVDAGGPKPALIIAFPVGFVGAAESKAELTGNPRGIPFITLLGRRGGSAMACAAMNAVAAGLST